MGYEADKDVCVAEVAKGDLGRTTFVIGIYQYEGGKKKLRITAWVNGYPKVVCKLSEAEWAWVLGYSERITKHLKGK